MFARNLVGSLLALACLAAVPSIWAQPDLPDIIEKISPSVVVIFVYDQADTVVAQGSGFFVNENGNVITNHHVIEGASRVEVKASDGKVYSVSSLLAEDVDGDLALLAVNVPKRAVRAAAVSQVLPRIGERIIVIGCPLGLEQTVSDGIVSSVRYTDTFGNIIQLTAPISAGSSGGPVVDMKGNVIGVATASMVGGQNLNFAIPGERVLGLLSRTVAELSTSPGFPRPPLLDEASAENLYREGLALVWAEEYEKALIKFEQAVARKPDYADAYSYIGLCNAELGRYREALQACERAIQLQPDYVKAWYNKGVALGNLGRYTEGLQAYERAIQLQPDLARAWFGKGWALGNLGHYAEELQAYEKAIQLQPDLDGAWIGKGWRLAKLGRYAEALQAYERAIQLKPDVAVAWGGKGAVLDELGRYAEALQAYETAIQLQPGYAGEWFAKGRALGNLERYGEALQSFERAIQLKPDYAEAWSGKALALQKLERYREAEQAEAEARRLRGR